MVKRSNRVRLGKGFIHIKHSKSWMFYIYCKDSKFLKYINTTMFNVSIDYLGGLSLRSLVISGKSKWVSGSNKSLLSTPIQMFKNFKECLSLFNFNCGLFRSLYTNFNKEKFNGVLYSSPLNSLGVFTYNLNSLNYAYSVPNIVKFSENPYILSKYFKRFKHSLYSKIRNDQHSVKSFKTYNKMEASSKKFNVGDDLVNFKKFFKFKSRRKFKKTRFFYTSQFKKNLRNAASSLVLNQNIRFSYYIDKDGIRSGFFRIRKPFKTFYRGKAHRALYLKTLTGDFLNYYIEFLGILMGRFNRKLTCLSYLRLKLFFKYICLVFRRNLTSSGFKVFRGSLILIFIKYARLFYKNRLTLKFLYITCSSLYKAILRVYKKSLKFSKRGGFIRFVKRSLRGSSKHVKFYNFSKHYGLLKNIIDKRNIRFSFISSKRVTDSFKVRRNIRFLRLLFSRNKVLDNALIKRFYINRFFNSIECSPIERSFDGYFYRSTEKSHNPKSFFNKYNYNYFNNNQFFKKPNNVNHYNNTSKKLTKLLLDNYKSLPINRHKFRVSHNTNFNIFLNFNRNRASV